MGSPAETGVPTREFTGPDVETPTVPRSRPLPYLSYKTMDVHFGDPKDFGKRNYFRRSAKFRVVLRDGADGHGGEVVRDLVMDFRDVG